MSSRTNGAEISTAKTPESSPDPGRGALTLAERFFRLFSDVRPGEGRTIAVMFANVLLILCAYYFIKPLREGWLAVSGIEGLTKMEVKAYSSFGQALLLVWVVGLYSRLVTRWPRQVLVARTTWACMAAMVVFWFLQPEFFISHLPYSGVVFYLWVGMFGVFVVAQFWAFAADLFTEERGNRLLPIIAIGATSGAVVGSFIAQVLTGWRVIGAEYLLVAALIPLGGSIWLTGVAHRRESASRPGAGSPAAPPGQRCGALRLVLGNRFLLAVAVITLLTNWVNTNGENLLFRVVQDVLARDLLAEGVGAARAIAFVRDGTTAFYGDFFFWVNVLALLLQAFAASRLLRFGGFGVIFLLLPAIALVSYSMMALVPVLWAIKWMKVAENATDYSINNTARHVLWLPMPAEVTYKGKPTIDSLFVRFGDGLAALTVLVGVQLLGLSVQAYFVLNVGLVLLWLGLGVWAVWTRRGAYEGLTSP